MRVAVSVVISLLAISANSQTQSNENPGTAPRRAWEWTVEERLADRLNPEKIRERAAAYVATLTLSQQRSIAAAASSSAEAAPGSPQVVTYYIDGRRNPELFLTHELFDFLLSGLASDASMRAKERASYGPSIRRLKFDDEAFWASLESVSSGYLAVRDKASFSQNEGHAHCAARYEALQGARRLFGPQRFDRLLYVVVAPSVVYSTTSMDRNHGDSLRRAEMGCPQ